MAERISCLTSPGAVNYCGPVEGLYLYPVILFVIMQVISTAHRKAKDFQSVCDSLRMFR